MNALILSGGGARGAYEAGVLSYLFEELPKKHKFCPRFDIVCGSSVGAINASFFASGAHHTKGMIENLTSTWEKLAPEKIIQFSFRKMLTLPLWGIRGTAPEQSALFDVTPLVEMLKHRISWPQLATNIKKGPLYAVTVSATDMETGVTVVFTHRKGGGAHPPSRDPYVVSVPSVIAPKHVLASAAIPLLFPPVKLKRRLYYDGSIRHSTPISPALRLGATHIFVISLRSPVTPFKFNLEEATNSVNPNFLYMAGKLFNAFMLDRLYYDLDRLQRVNAIIEMGEKTYGLDFLKELNKTVVPLRGVPYRKVKFCTISPSEDLGDLAAHVARMSRLRQKRRTALRTLLETVARVGFIEHSDLLSYVLFDAPYTRALIDLGRQDARQKEEEILAFFQGEPAVGQ